MIFVLAREGIASAEKVALHVYRNSDLFKALGFSALKARAGMLRPGNVIKSGCYEFVVDEDELSEFVVVHIILPRADIEALGEAASIELGLDTRSLSDTDMSEWKGIFVDKLKLLLGKWQEIKCLTGPGENLTFEKVAYRKESRPWR
jgi:hypothetical protein